MIRKLLFLLLFTAVATAQPAYPDDATEDSIDFGLGIKLISSFNIYMPIPLDNNLTIEPFLSYFSDSWEDGSGSYHRKTTYTDTSIGFGLYKSVFKNDIGYYYGGRLGFMQHKDSTDYEDRNEWDEEDTYSGYFLYPVIGAEYFFTSHLSISGELHPLYYQVLSGTEEEDDETDKFEGSTIYTTTAVMLRWYY